MDNINEKREKNVCKKNYRENYSYYVVKKSLKKDFYGFLWNLLKSQLNWDL